MVKIRLHGTLEELEKVQKVVSSQLNILSKSTPYKDRGDTEYYRIYMDCEMKIDGKEECS